MLSGMEDNKWWAFADYFDFHVLGLFQIQLQVSNILSSFIFISCEAKACYLSNSIHSYSLLSSPLGGFQSLLGNLQ